MSMDRVMGGEGASTPWIRRETGTTPGLVVCPMFSQDSSMDVMAAQEIYRMAYEKAQASLRPSAYELALKAGWN